VRFIVHNTQGQRLFEAEAAVNLKHQPACLRDPNGEHPEVYLDWDRTLDDQGRLRRCPICGCPDLYQRPDFPRLTVFLIILAAGTLVMAFAGIAWFIAGLILLALVGLLDLGLYLFTGQSIVCYRCGSEFRGVPKGGSYRRWDSSVAEKYH
jgi:hypothetical protein